MCILYKILFNMLIIQIKERQPANLNIKNTDKAFYLTILIKLISLGLFVDCMLEL